MKNETESQKNNVTFPPSHVFRSTEKNIINERYYHGVDIIALLIYLLKRVVWIVIAATIGGVIGGYQYSKNYVPVYQATSKIYIAGSENKISISDLQLGSVLSKDFQEVFKIWQVHEAVAERLASNYSASTLSDMVSVKVPTGSHILYINTLANDPEEARELADTYAEVVQEFIFEEMELRKPRIIEKAQLPQSPISFNSRQSIKDGATIGGILATFIFIVSFLIDDRIRSADDISNAVVLPVLGSLPLQHHDQKPIHDVLTDSTAGGRLTAIIRAFPAVDDHFSESINAICTAISFSGNGLKKIVITSSKQDEGKTFTALQLSAGMAQRGKRTLLIDCDLRKSVFLSRYDIRLGGNGFGLAHILSGQCTSPEAVYATNISNLSLIPVGETVKTSLFLLSSAELEEILEKLQNFYDYIILDSPPVGTIIDAAEIARCCDGSILVVENKKTRIKELKESVKRLSQTDTPILGYILNKVSGGRREFAG